MSVFKAYDIRGIYGDELNEALAYKIGRNLPALHGGRRVLIGRDARMSSPALTAALANGLTDAGCDVDIAGLTSTPMVYFFTAEFDYDLSIQVTASHNPSEYNGFKISRRGALPVGYDTGLKELEELCRKAPPPPVADRGKMSEKNYLPYYIAFLKKHLSNFADLKIVIDCCDGMASLTAHELFKNCKSIFLADTPDGTFPSHTPNPLEESGRTPIIEAVKKYNADLGIIFDGDADRVMFIDEKGRFVQPDLMIAVMAPYFLRTEPGSPILHDIRTSRGVTETLEAMGARPYIWKVGHAYAKIKLRELQAPFGGEYAGHYYFRDFHWCDSGELASIIALGEIAAAKKDGKNFSDILAPIAKYLSSGEINLKIENKDEAITHVISALTKEAGPRRILDFDGIRLDYDDWWISQRKSTTAPNLRLMI